MAATRENHFALVGIFRADRSEDRRNIPGQPVPPYLPHKAEAVEKRPARRNPLGAAGAHANAPVDEPASSLDRVDECGPHPGSREAPASVHRLIRTEALQVTDNPPHHASPLPGSRGVRLDKVLEWSFVVTPQLDRPRDRARWLPRQNGCGVGYRHAAGLDEIGGRSKAMRTFHGWKYRSKRSDGQAKFGGGYASEEREPM